MNTIWIFICGIVIGLVIGILVCDLGQAEPFGWEQNQQRRFNDIEHEQRLQQQQMDYNRIQRNQRHYGSPYTKEPC